MLLLLALTGCLEYDLGAKDVDAEGADDTGGLVDSADPGDSGDGGGDGGDGGCFPLDTADAPVYVNSATTLYSIDPAVGSLELVGDFTGVPDDFQGMTDIAIDLDGRMVGVSYGTLYWVDASTAAVEKYIDIDEQNAMGLTFVSDGRLVVAGEAVSLVDTDTGAITTVVAAGRYDTSGDIVGLPDGLLYWTVQGGDGLVVVDPNLGHTSFRGDIGVEKIWGLGYSEDTLYGFTGSGQMVGVDPETAAPLQSASVGEAWWGAATNPVLW